jgi:hypothetical protein
MSYTLNVSRLNSLKQWNCPHSLDFLGAIVSSGRTPRLRSFELVIDSDHHEAEIRSGVIPGFLQAFKGLEDLSLMLPKPINWNSVVPGILAHKSNFETTCGSWQKPDYFGNPGDGDIPSSTIEQLYGEVRLSCLGICMAAFWLVRPPVFPYQGSKALFSSFGNYGHNLLGSVP